MANVTIYAEHREILDYLITSGKVSSVAGATKTGPFKEQRDAYVFAASIAMALNSPTKPENMPSGKKENTQIRDSVFIGAAGAKELSLAAALILETNHDKIDQSLAYQLDLISEEQLAERLTLLDRFAHGGFAWLEERRPDESNICDLILTTIDEIACYRSDDGGQLNVHDPLLDMLGMQL